jgi:hypothetical protein
MLEAPLRFHAAARQSNGDSSMPWTIQDGVLASGEIEKGA